jgi:hypothetical protein
MTSGWAHLASADSCCQPVAAARVDIMTCVLLLSTNDGHTHTMYVICMVWSRAARFSAAVVSVNPLWLMHSSGCSCPAWAESLWHCSADSRSCVCLLMLHIIAAEILCCKMSVYVQHLWVLASAWYTRNAGQVFASQLLRQSGSCLFVQRVPVFVESSCLHRLRTSCCCASYRVVLCWLHLVWLVTPS